MVKLEFMATFQTKITSQGQVSVPAEVRKGLGVEPGAMLEWVLESGQAIVRRKGRYTWDDLNEIARPYRPEKPVTLEEMDEAIAQGAVERYERSIRTDDVEDVEVPKRTVKKHASR